jgi:outer membrane lipoprotein-sorting protein
MRKSAFLVIGIAIGVFVAKRIETNPEAKKSLENAAAKIKEFSSAVASGYREQESIAANPSKASPRRTSKGSTTTAKRGR